MTLLVEKCNYEKSPQIDDAIRLLAFADWAAGHKLKQITLASANQPLAECLRRWCKNTSATFKWRQLPKATIQVSWIRRIYFALPRIIQAWVWLMKYLMERWPLRGAGLQAWQQAAGSVTFVSYLFNLVPEAAKEGRYESRYWGPLPEILQSEGCMTNWLHLYLKDPFLPNAKQVCGIIRAFNERGRGIEIHATLDSFLSFSVVCQAIQDWVKLTWKGKRLHGLSALAKQVESDLWPLLVEDLKESMGGITAMSNSLHRGLFEAAMKMLPKQQVGFYLQENQGWEFALVQNWRIASHGQLIGVPHSTVRFWDLRYFFDPRSYQKHVNQPMPLPDKVALNGQAATDAYLTGGYPSEDLIQVEALRYLYLLKVKERPVSDSANRGQSLRLLVLGDYLINNTRRQMRLLDQAVTLLPPGSVITFKPHPACQIDAMDYPKLQLRLATEPLMDLLAACDVAYTSAVTSAAVDAYCVGVPVVSVIDQSRLNMSPLRGYPDTFYVGTSDELIRVLYLVSTLTRGDKIRSNFFLVDKELRRWRQLVDHTYI